MKKEKTFDNSNTTTNSKQLAVLKTNFPQCFDKKGDFIPRKMQEVVAKDGINLSKEAYSLNWLGKSYARLLANEQPLTLLKEDTDHNQKSQNQNSENLLIKGDNLEVLKHLRRAYSGSIKMIYIDPPYNTGGDDFVYQDDRKFTPEQLQRLAGIDEDEAQRILDFTNSNSNSHSAWLTFIYPRLYIARELLTDDGVIFISIDDNEQAQLKMLCDEVFGEDNFVGDFIWNKKNVVQNDATHLSINHEYVLIYAKSYTNLIFNLIRRNEEQLDRYKNPDNDYRGNWTSVALQAKSGSSVYEIEFDNGIKWQPVEGTYPRLSRESLMKAYKDNRLWFGKSGKNIPRLKKYLSEVKNGVVSSSLLLSSDYGSTQLAKEKLKKLFKNNIFDTPKPVGLINKFLNLSTNKNDIILDFFAGSGTTADAVMQLNAQDGGNRKFIMVQLPEPIDKNKNKTAYDFVKNELDNSNPTIFDITKERVLRAGTKILNDNEQAKAKDKKDLSTLDTDFKVFETLPMFEGYFDEMDALDEQQDLFDGKKLSDEDLTVLLTSWMVGDGIKLTFKSKPITLDKYTGYYVDKKLYLMDKGFTTNDLKALLEKLDNDKDFQPNKIILFGYNFESKHQREISEALKNYTNKKQIELDRVVRY